MGYVTIVWGASDKDMVIRYLIQALGDYLISYKQITVSRDGLENCKKRMNLLIQEYLRHKYIVEIPLLDKDDNHEDWKIARRERHIDFQVFEIFKCDICDGLFKKDEVSAIPFEIEGAGYIICQKCRDVYFGKKRT